MDETPSAAAAIVVVTHRDIENSSIPSVLSPAETLHSLCRTLSDDMSSHRFLPRVPDHPPHIEDSSDEEDERLRFEIWNSIRGDYKMMRKEKGGGRDRWPGEFDIWRSSIELWKRSQWSEAETAVPPPYVHPHVRRFSSCLSEKSLEICTESLGSESGSDGLSLFPPTSETGSDYSSSENDGKSEGSLPVAFCQTDVEQGLRDKPTFHARGVIPRIKGLSRSFPPPLTYLSSAADCASVQMQSRRENGRLILEAVQLPYNKNFRARRENGRLLLALTVPYVNRCDGDAVDDQSAEKQEVAKKGVDSEDGNDAKEEGIETESTVNIAAGSSKRIAIAMNNLDETTHRPLPPLPLKGYRATKKQAASRDEHGKNMEECWASVMKNRRSLFFPDATMHCHVVT